MNIKLISALAATALLSAAPSFAATVTFDFENVVGGLPVGDTQVDGFSYSFAPDLLGAVNDEFSQFFSNAPSPIGVMTSVGTANALNMVSPNGAFVDAVSFAYSATTTAFVSVWSGLNGTGTNLGTIQLAANAGSCAASTPFCLWQTATLSFAGGARSITFDTPFDAAFDNVQVNAVPLPAAGWLLMSAVAGFGAWRRKRAAA